jgi:hypothetical protein
MAKKHSEKTYTGGAADRKRRGLVSVMIPVTPEVRDLLHLAVAHAVRTAPLGQRVSLASWGARVLEEAALAVVARAEEKEKPAETEKGP